MPKASKVDTIEMQYAETSDEKLIDTVYYLYETISRLQDAKKIDEELEALRAAVSEYSMLHYDCKIKPMREHLEAARNQLKSRGVKMPFERAPE